MTLHTKMQTDFFGGNHRQRRRAVAIAAPVNPPSAFRLILTCSAVGSLLLGLGCDQLFGPNQAQCDQSVATVRQAISFGQFESASQWRDYSWKVCGDTPIVAAIDRELVEAKQNAEKEKELAHDRARKLAQARINGAQKVWRAFDALKAKERTADRLAATLKSAERQAKGLTEELAKQLSQYNVKQMNSRKSKLK